MSPPHAFISTGRSRIPRCMAVVFTVFMTLSGLLASPIAAMPFAPEELCANYPNIAVCRHGPAQCSTCHTHPPERNAFGRAFAKSLDLGPAGPGRAARYAAGFARAFQAIEGDDADGDGITNLDELISGSDPADLQSRPRRMCSSRERRLVAHATTGYKVCGPDWRYVYRKVLLDFCGRSPTLAEFAEFDAAPNPLSVLDSTLDTCLDSQWWQGQDGVVWNLANERIQPMASLKSGKDRGPIALGDYFDDYNLFVWTQLDNHDARQVLTAQYFVQRDKKDPSKLTTFVRTPQQDFKMRKEGGSQNVPIDARAGMLTARWSLMRFIMFTPIPRTAAAHAYRVHLGYNLAVMEGIFAVPGEPPDYDAKGVALPACVKCHSTLDPLAYPFSRYDGIGGGTGGSAGYGPNDYLPYSYNAERLQRFIHTDSANVVRTPEAGVIFGQPVANLVEWASVAANSPAFARKLVLDYWLLLVGGPPQPSELAEFQGLWRDFMTRQQYGVERMLHGLIRTRAYAIP